jgi:hypothetical protein
LKVGSIKSDFEDNNIILNLLEFENGLSASKIDNLIINTRV